MRLQQKVIDEKIFVISGTTKAYSDNVIDLTQIYDTKTDTWNQGTSILYTVQQAGASATTGNLAPKAVYIIGDLLTFIEP